MESQPKQAKGTEDWAFFVPSSFQDSVSRWLSWEKKEREDPLSGIFSVGDTLYDNPKAYLIWSDALRYFQHCVTVNETVGDKIRLTLHKSIKTGLETVGQFTVSTQELMGILKTGKLPA